MNKEVKIFIISPNDVKPERKIVRDICEELNSQVGNKLDIVPIMWEDEPFTYTKNPQENIDHLLEESDIYVVILWHRLGSKVEGCTGAITKEDNVTGTQYEIEKILSLGKEHILFYFKRLGSSFGNNELEEALKQKKLLEKFLVIMELRKNSTKHGYHEFGTTETFKSQIKKHLAKEIEKVTSVKIQYKVNSQIIKKIVFYSAFIIVLSVSWILLWEKETTVQISSVTPIMHEESKKNVFLENSVYIENQKNIDPYIYQTLIILLKKKKYEIIDKDTNANYILQIKQELNEKKNIISDVEVMQVVCVLQYTLLGKKNSKVIDSNRIKEEAIGFDVQYAKTKCIEKIIKKMPVLFKE